MKYYLCNLLSDIGDPKLLHGLFPTAFLLRFLHGYIIIGSGLQTGILVALDFKVRVSQNDRV